MTCSWFINNYEYVLAVIFEGVSSFMKEINGTVTLAYLEEDNKQRVIFRVVPLCTREGSVFSGDTVSFPDEGSLRVVPDKREQSTFKERMRELGSLCAIYLINEGKDLMKVRPNRNYSPDQGERNQFAIYSDVICEFAEDSCFEVVDAGVSADGALTERVLIYKDKLLYGPVEKDNVASVAPDTLKPFGNDRFLLHSISSPSIGSRRVYWNPEATASWRQHRTTIRKREKVSEHAPRDIEAAKEITAMPTGAPEVARPEPEKHDEQKPTPVKQAAPFKPAIPIKQAKQETRPAPVSPEKPAAAKNTVEKPPVDKPAIEKRAVEKPAAEKRAADKPAYEKLAAEKSAPVKPAPVSEHEASLPIGSRLEILDTEMSFDAQIDRLAQPLSENANRLTDVREIPVDDPDEVVAHFTGTPLIPPAVRVKRSASRPDTMHQVVEQQLKGQRNEVMGAEIGSGVYGMIENPIETLQSCIDYVWQNSDMRRQAIEALESNESFMSDMIASLRRGGRNLQATAAAEEQLSEIEAERLSLIMQLETSKANEAKFREEALKALSQKKRDESERLKREVQELRELKNSLKREAELLSAQSSQKLVEYIEKNITCLSGCDEERILLSPVIGHDYKQAELAEQLRVHMNDSGYSISEDDAMNLLVSFSLYDTLCFRDSTLEDAGNFACIMLESFGLQSVSAVVMPGAYVEMVSLLNEDARRAPTATIQPIGTETMTVFGHKTIFLADNDSLASTDAFVYSYPVISVPKLQRRASDYAEEWKPLAPASLASFAAVRADSRPLLGEAEKWFAQLSSALVSSSLRMPDISMQMMRRFIEVASRKVRGGFLSAADSAVAFWIVPMLQLRSIDSSKLADALAGLPHTLNILGIR